MTTTTEKIKTIGDGDSITVPMHRPCVDCRTWPEVFWLVEGHTADGTGRCSFGHQDTLEEAQAQLADLKTEHPKYTVWEITECIPATIVKVVHLEGMN